MLLALWRMCQVHDQDSSYEENTSRAESSVPYSEPVSEI